MNSFFTIASFFLFVVISHIEPLINNSLLPESKIQRKPTDTIPKFRVDGYPVTDEMLGPNAHNRKSGEISDVEGAWFSNDTLKQTLVFVLYTDYHRMVTYHFLNNDIPAGIINRMELHTADGELASDKLKQKYFKGFPIQTTKIGKSYFKTYKGFKMGDNKEKALKVYGKPDKTKIENGIEKYEWDFIGDAFYDKKTKLKRNILAEGSFGHQTIMFFRNNKLIGIIFHNDIP